MPLFYDDEFHPLRACVEEGKGYKESAAHLWPTMKPESAYAKLKACVAEDGRERLKFGEIIALMRFNVRFDPLYYACAETLHAQPTRVAPKDAEAQALAVVDNAAQTLERSLKMLAEYRQLSATVPPGLRR